MKTLLRELFNAAIAAASPSHCLPSFVPEPGAGRTFVIGAGKAAAAMAASFVSRYAAPVEGVIVTRYGHGTPALIPGIEILEAGHPIVDAAGLAAGRRILEVAGGALRGDRLIVLLSGGASALMESPLPGLALDDLVEVNRRLLAAGADIGEINTVRRRLSAIKGGRLAAVAAPAELYVFAISDVPGDRFADIGSGPCSADPEPADAALRVMERWRCEITPAVRAVLDAPQNRPLLSGNPAFTRVRSRIIACGADAVTAACRAAERAGFTAHDLGADINLPATQLAAMHARMALGLTGRHALVSGGETTVRVTNPRGRGGRNTQYLLELAIALGGAEGISALAADTDGIDGTEMNAGAVITPDTLTRAATGGFDPDELLHNNCAWDFFDGLGDLVCTGPTGTNVNDLRVILVDVDC